MAATVFLHIGCPKSGTSHIQARLRASVDVAREQGLFWPSPWGRQVQATRDARTVGRRRPLDPGGAWTELSQEILASDSERALVSMEWLVGLRQVQIDAIAAALEPARVEVICTARDLLRSFPAHWQESMQNYRTWAWEEYVDAVTGDHPGHPAYKEFWRQHDVPKILTRWSGTVPWDRIHLVTVPPAGGDRDLLWRRFCTVVSLDPGEFLPPSSSNPSLGVVSATLMERINVAAAARGVSKDFYLRQYKKLLSKQVLAGHRGRERPIAVSAATDAWARRRAQALVDDLSGLPINVVGDVAELIPGEHLDGLEPSMVPEAELLAAAVETVIDLLEARPDELSG